MMATPVLAICYEEQCGASDFVRMKYALYISKSKGGAQYLDSLDGQVKSLTGRFFRRSCSLSLPSNEMAAISRLVQVSQSPEDGGMEANTLQIPVF